MSFRNPILAGPTLVREAIQSGNYAAGSAGWRVEQTGNAEFNELTLRGTFLGTESLINSDGIFFYSSTPAAGNLIGSWSAKAGTDPYGNAYQAGFGLQNGQAVYNVIPDTGAIIQNWETPNPGTSLATHSVSNTNFTGTAMTDVLLTITATNATNGDTVFWQLQSNNTAGTSPASFSVISNLSSGARTTLLNASYTGVTVTGSLTAVKPGTGTASVAPVPEVWHTASLATGFTTSSSDQVPRYRLEGIGGGLVRLDGVVFTSAATATNATMFTLPTGYRPIQRKRFAGTTNASGYTVVGATLVSVATTGVVSLSVSTGGAGTQVILDGITFPVD